MATSSSTRPPQFCIWQRVLPRAQLCRAAQGRRPIRRGRCASLSALPPGGGSDIMARLIGQWLSERLGQHFLIDNRPGASGNIGVEAVVRAPADGYTLLITNRFTNGSTRRLTTAQLRFHPRHRSGCRHHFVRPW